MRQLENWKIGRLENWKNGRLEKWKIRKLEDWNDGVIVDSGFLNQLIFLRLSHFVASSGFVNCRKASVFGVVLASQLVLPKP